MPITFVTVFVASLSLVGMFPLAGFWSKDEILANAWEDKWWVFAIGMTGVYLTALYVGRMMILTFWGEYKGGEESEHGGHHGEPHESPPLMTLPLVVLAVLAIGAGAFQLDHWLGHIIEGWLPQETHEHLNEGGFEYWIAILSVGLGLAGLLTAGAVYYWKVFDSAKTGAFLEPLPEILEKKYYLDILYQDVFVKMFLLGGAAWLLSLWDKYVVDGVVNGAGRATTWVAGQIRVAQAGQTQIYASVALFGAVAAIVGILLVSGS